MNMHEPVHEPTSLPMSRIGSTFGSTFRVAAHHFSIEIHAILAHGLPYKIF
jgi:hypothetical protein